MKIRETDGGTIEVDCIMENVQEEAETELEMLNQNYSMIGKTEEHIESNRFLQKQKDTESEEDNNKGNVSGIPDDDLSHCNEECLDEDDAVAEELESVTQICIPNSPSHNEETTVVSIENNDFINETDMKIMIKNFELFDTDNTGYICFSKLGSYARSLGRGYSYKCISMYLVTFYLQG